MGQRRVHGDSLSFARIMRICIRFAFFLLTSYVSSAPTSDTCCSEKKVGETTYLLMELASSASKRVVSQSPALTRRNSTGAMRVIVDLPSGGRSMRHVMG